MHRKILGLNNFAFSNSLYIDPDDPVAEIESVCTHIRENGVVDITSELEYRIFNIISFCSVVGSITIFMTGMWNPKLAQHPYRLVSTIALIDATYFLLFNTLDEVCDLSLYKCFAATVFFTTDAAKQYRSLVIILRCSLTLFKTLFVSSFLLNAFLCVDLYLTVKSPFTPASSRTKFYYIFSFSFGTAVSVYESIHYSQSVDQAAYAEEITILSAFLIFIAIAIPSTVFASRRILRKGVSESVRRAVVSRHIKYILILTFTFALYAWKIFMEDILDDAEAYWLDQLSVYAFAS